MTTGAIVILSVLSTIIVCIGLVCYIVEYAGNGFKWPFLSLIAYIVWPASLLCVIIYFTIFEKLIKIFKSDWKDDN